MGECVWGGGAGGRGAGGRGAGGRRKERKGESW